ncbi:MAG: type VI secretion system baseplate subunit TssK [Planctomycetes bacterium]|nr:type VI secretion system baseplate subunit TssK [Planctomycetota bacterium]
MDYRQKVHWSEGLFLTPHHFQQWDRYHENLLRQGMRAIQPLYYGVAELKFDETALTGGELVLSRCAAIMPDGMIVDLPELDEAPPSRPLAAAFAAKQEKLGVYLVAPLARDGSVGVSAAGETDGRATRFKSRSVKLRDENTGADERDVPAALKNLRLVFEGESLDEAVSLKIAEVMRTETGAYKLNTNYVPPLLSIAASPYLMSLLRRLVEITSAKSVELSQQRRQRSQGLVQFTTSEAANFWLLNTVNAHIPGLIHLFNHTRSHPETMYLELARLAGTLYTFTNEGQPKDVPPYAHEDLGGTFAGLEKQLRALLETTIASRCVPIPVEKINNALYAARLVDDRMVAGAQFFLAVGSASPPEKVVSELPLKAKVSSRDRVDKLIAQAMRGLPLKYVAAPPPDVPVQPGRSYFQVEKAGEHWEAIANTRTIAMYFPPEFQDLKLELMAIKD